MRFSIFVLVSTFYLTNSFAVENEYAKDTLSDTYGKIIHASVLFRHGDRSIERPYPTDPNPISVWPDGLGQLTKKGKQQEYDLGAWLRTRYEIPLDLNTYYHDRIMVNSSDVDRTLMSAELVLASLFPPSHREMWNNQNLTWQPIPVHTKPVTEDVIAWETVCDRYDLEIALLNDSPEFQAFYLENKALFDYVATHSGCEISPSNVWKAVHELSGVYDDLFIENRYNLTLPSWTEKVFPQPLNHIANFSFSIIAYTHEMRRLKGGPFIADFIKDMLEKQSGRTNQSLHLYSGHDSTIATVLSTLNIFNYIAPPYSSCILIELRKKNDDFVVTISYKNSTTSAPYLLHIPDCPAFCTLDRFIKVTENLIPTDWKAECKVNIYKRLIYMHTTEIIVISGVSMLLMIVLIAIRLHIKRRNRYAHYECVINDVLKPNID